MCRILFWTTFLVITVAILPAKAAENTDAFARVVQPFLQQHCFGCHGPKKQNARIRYDELNSFRNEDRHLWTLVHEQLTAGKMPPEDRAQPAASDKQQVLSWIEQQQLAIRAGGTRRLNRRELSAALRDVTGLSVDYTLGLPDDGKVDGFDTGAVGLQDAADSVTQIMQVTRRAIDAIRFLEPPSSEVFAVDLRNFKDVRQAFDKWKDRGAGLGKGGDTFCRPGTGMFLNPKWVGEDGGLKLKIPLPAKGRSGVLRLKIVVSARKFVEGIPNPRLWVRIGGREIDFPEITNPPEQPRSLVYEVQLNDLAIDAQGVGITLCNRVELPYAVEGFENDEQIRSGKGKTEESIPGGKGLFRPLFDQRSMQPDQKPVPYVVVHSIEIDPDYRAVWPSAEWEASVGRIGDDTESAQRLLGLWIERAWRRPVSRAEQERFLALYTTLRAQSLSFDNSLRAAFQSVLLSGSFRYLASPGDIDTAGTQHVVASRLSFMLWGAPPDQELRKLAAEGKLRDPATLDRQVDRMMADPRSEAFMRPFVAQWLELDQPITVAMDNIQKQDFRFGRYLKASMREQTIAYVRQLFLNNRPAREIIVSDWTMMNDILARHYGYPGVEGGQLRQVKLRDEDPRGGGILGHAGIQSMLCWMGENWVIYRGAWTLRHILDDPPRPPPLEVPELIPSDSKNHGKSFKELLRQHQEDARCAMCHKRMDPLGFAFQNFDISGRWRDVEFDHYATKDLDGKIEWRGVGNTRPVDAVGTLPRGESFGSFSECKALLVKNYSHDLVRGLLKNLVIYGTGCKPDVHALKEIRATLSDLKPKGYPLRDLLKAVVRSRAFLEN